MDQDIRQPQEADGDDIVVLEDENGNVQSFAFLELVSVDGVPYAVLLPLEDEDDESGVVIVEVADLGMESEHYDAVTDEVLCERIFEQFRSEFKDKYDFA